MSRNAKVLQCVPVLTGICQLRQQVSPGPFHGCHPVSGAPRPSFCLIVSCPAPYLLRTRIHGSVESVACDTLSTLNHERLTLRSLLFRLALIDNTASSKCVLWSMLALASFHRHGQGTQTAQLKHFAVHLLASSSSKNRIGKLDGVRHLAANMILSASEVCLQYVPDFLQPPASANPVTSKIAMTPPPGNGLGFFAARALYWILSSMISR